MKTPVISLDEYCGSFSSTLKHIFPSLSQTTSIVLSLPSLNFIFGSILYSLIYLSLILSSFQPLDASAHFSSKENILAEYDPDHNIPDIDNDIDISNHEELDSSNKDASGDNNMVKVKSIKQPAHIIKPPACATPIIEVLAHSSTSGKTKQKPWLAASSPTQITIKAELSLSKHK
ncbi:hypothetical protein Moror_15855, partial [Moniliophthora roreri MCA 2997]